MHLCPTPAPVSCSPRPVLSREERGRRAAKLWIAFATVYQHQWAHALPVRPEGYPSLAALQHATGHRCGANMPAREAGDTSGRGFAHRSSSGRVTWMVDDEARAVVRILRPSNVIVIEAVYEPDGPFGPLLVPDARLVLTAAYEPRHVREITPLFSVLAVTGHLDSDLVRRVQRMLDVGARRSASASVPPPASFVP